MEIIVTRIQMICEFRNKEINEIIKQDFRNNVYLLFKECDKVTFRDDTGEELVLKNRYSVLEKIILESKNLDI